MIDSEALINAGIFPVGIFTSIEVDILWRKVTGIDGVIGLPKVKIDRNGELIPGGDIPQRLERCFGHQSSFARDLAVVGNVDELLPDPRPGVADRMNNAAPVRISTIP